MRNLISYFLSVIIGGQSEVCKQQENAIQTKEMFLIFLILKEHTFVNIHNMTYNIFTGTSVGIVKHFYQIWRRGRFQVRICVK
jgi:hypothetical protein